MRRPLLGACLLFIGCVIGFYVCLSPEIMDYSSLNEKTLYVSGTVVAIDTQVSYGMKQIIYTLDNVKLYESLAEPELFYTQNQIYCYSALLLYKEN